MNIFRNHNQNKTAKDYIERKRNFNLFYDLSNNPIKNKLSYVKGNKITKVNNHSNLINLTKGYFDFHQSGRCVDISANLQSSYDFEKFNKKECPVIKNNITDNTGLNNVYTGIALTNEGIPDVIINSTTNNIKNYAEVKMDQLVGTTNDGNKFTYDKKIQTVNCIKLHTNKTLF